MINSVRREVDELVELKYEIERTIRDKENLQKNLERRKKAYLIDADDEKNLIEEIKDLEYTANALKKKMRAIESSRIRERMFADQ
jgi:hypothetical protein